MKSSKYWINRAKKELLETENMEEETIAKLVMLYKRSNKYIRSEIKKVFDRYADKGQLSNKQARAYLNLEETNEYYENLEKKLPYATGKQKKYIELKLEARPYGARIARLEALKVSIESEILKFKGVEEKITKDLYTNIIKKQYLTRAFSDVDDKLVNQMLKRKWYGGNYSSRIWKNKDELKKAFDEIIEPGYLTGRPYVQIADEVAQKLDVELYKATRLVRTEGNYFHNQAILEGFEDAGIEEYEYRAVLDSRTSEMCREKDGQIFKVKDAEVGKNYPPLHPFCRSTAIMVTDKKERTARDMVTGENYKTTVQTYESYHVEQIEKYKDDPEKIESIKKQNRRYDFQQFKNFNNVLTDDDFKLNKFEDFIELKYNNNDEYKLMAYNYKLKNEVINEEAKTIEKIYVDEKKYTGYIFNPKNKNGFAKGENINSVLGYNKGNYLEFDKKIKENISKYPCKYKNTSEYGDRYEVNMVMLGMKGRQAKLTVGVLKEKETNKDKLTSIYINKLKKGDI